MSMAAVPPVRQQPTQYPPTHGEQDEVDGYNGQRTVKGVLAQEVISGPGNGYPDDGEDQEPGHHVGHGMPAKCPLS